MLTANPWVVYVSFVTPILAAYYLLVGFIFYRHDLTNRIWRWKSPPAKAASFPFQPLSSEAEPIEETNKFAEEHMIANTDNYEDSISQQPWENEGLMQQLEALSMHLIEAIQEAHSKEYSKEEFILLVQMTFKEYPAIYGTPFELSVNQLIEAELAKYGSIHLSSEDRLRMWNQVD